MPPVCGDPSFHDLAVMVGKLQVLVDQLEKRILDRFAGLDQNMMLATTMLDKRLDGMNHLQAQLKDLSNNMISRAEHNVLEKDVRHLQQVDANRDGRIAVIGAISGFLASLSIGVVLLLLAHWWR